MTSESVIKDDEYKGEYDTDGFYQGMGRLVTPFEVYEGEFQHGVKHGRGKLVLCEEGCTLLGTFVDGQLQGLGSISYEGGSTIEGFFNNSTLHGDAIEFDEDGSMYLECTYNDGIRDASKLVKIHYAFGGHLQGLILDNDDFDCPTGDNFIFVYPCGKFGLIGSWIDGELISANFVYLETYKEDRIVYSRVAPDQSGNLFQDINYTYFESTEAIMCKDYLLSDPCESHKVIVKTSICNKQYDPKQGLFAKVLLQEGDVVSYYNGIRLTHEVVDNRDWSLNSNTIALNIEEVIDVPAPYDQLDHYCASLGHKANHAFDNNARYAPFYHPRFGFIMSIKATKDIQQGQEILVNYAYRHEDLPEWYTNLEITQ